MTRAVFEAVADPRESARTLSSEPRIFPTNASGRYGFKIST
jgi:hypothetical protein